MSTRLSPNQSSLLLSYSAESVGSVQSANSKIDAIIALAEEAKLKVTIDQDSTSFSVATHKSSLVGEETADLIVCKNVSSIVYLAKFLDYHTTNFSIIGQVKRFVISTVLTADQLRPLADDFKDIGFVFANVAESIVISTDTDRNWAMRAFPLAPTVIKSTKSILMSLIVIGKDEKRTSQLTSQIFHSDLTSSLVNPGSHPFGFSKPENLRAGDLINDIAICSNVTKIKDLRRLIRDYARFFRQFIIFTTLSEKEIYPFEPLNGELTEHKFKYLNLDATSTSTTSVADDFNNAVSMLTAEWKPHLAHNLSTLSTSSISSKMLRFKRKSLLISGPSDSNKSAKIDAAVRLAKEAGLTVDYFYSIDERFPVKPFKWNVIVYQDVSNVTRLCQFLKERVSANTQFFISTSIELGDSDLYAQLFKHDFDVVLTSSTNYRDKSLPSPSEWARQHFLGED